jgi:hypothetical protein
VGIGASDLILDKFLNFLDRMFRTCSRLWLSRVLWPSQSVIYFDLCSGRLGLLHGCCQIGPHPGWFQFPGTTSRIGGCTMFFASYLFSYWNVFFLFFFLVFLQAESVLIPVEIQSLLGYFSKNDMVDPCFVNGV